ncbi:branched-chain amino acid ABC transporter permease [Dactylosporangium sucinum]|uniref:Branched-chain amino acid ABC transporter permease n=1 Tax=Dactylosporangium sucinum TaxID=1424081 RepID=A0A917X6J9_9ACTN|nr:branched-chain amino acid ABC transporter permease [Dactylosporangium sucinum]GGM75305.1 branched-chain amino acid ABC transporter permease [Dactylosporangium sucinum]
MTIVWAGLSVGAVYALTAIGYNITMTFGGVFNFAHGAFVILSAFFSWYVMVDLGWPWWSAALLGAVLGALLGGIEELVAVRPVLRRTDTRALLVTTVGAFVVIEGVLAATWGATPKSVGFFAGEDAFTFLGGRMAPVDVWLVVVAVVAGAGLHVFSRRSLWGLAARGATSDPDAAKARGINVGALRAGGFALAGALAGLLGPLVTPKTGASVGIAVSMTIFGFVALAVGGFGSFAGCVVGGLLVGLIQAYGSRYLGVEYPPLLLFIVLLAVLLLKPTGLFGKHGMRAV